VEVLSPEGHIHQLSRHEIEFFYRGSSLVGTRILAAVFNLKKGQKNDILKKINQLMLRRSQGQPLGTWNAGSVFKNPAGNSAGRLIEAAGLKGLRFGGAEISQKHANFIINTGNARASDVRSLVTMVHQKVKEQFNIDLELEIKIIGE
jgi:UDP-N-acetylmuramate dehydrogenase